MGVGLNAAARLPALTGGLTEQVGSHGPQRKGQMAPRSPLPAMVGSAQTLQSLGPWSGHGRALHICRLSLKMQPGRDCVGPQACLPLGPEFSVG